MKKIEAIVEQYEFEKLRDMLAKAGLTRIRAIEVKEYGTSKGLMITYRGATQTTKYFPKIKIELICTEPATEIAMAIIAELTKSSRIEDGDLFVSALSEDVGVGREEVAEVAL